ncbi:nucleotidyl transferase AbiEii/AbiGii toxin family protein [bacterium]|nr:nucleotidyl transferase AbiEii/AbiGii toxin family protein [bacterium]
MFDWRKHKIIMVQILKDIYQNVRISSLLGFKGGTAAYLFYGLNRRSADLDFDLLKPEDKNLVYQEIKRISGKYTRIKQQYIKKNTIFFLLSYGEEERNIKIEISTRELGNHYQVLDYLGIGMLVIKKEDMFANKLIALTQRKKIANRDIFDLYYFFSNRWDINENIIKLRTGKNLNEYLKDCIKCVERVNNNQILQGLGELVEEKQKQWIKKNLKKDLLFLMRAWS